MGQPVQHVIGIDVAKLSLDISGAGPLPAFTVNNAQQGFDLLVQKLDEINVSLILMEATGGLESGVRSQESGVRSQESGVRSQESGVRSQESGVRSQE